MVKGNPLTTKVAKSKGKTANADNNTLALEMTPAGQPKSEALAQAALRPSVKGASTVRPVSQRLLPDLNLMAVVAELNAQANAVIGGNLKRQEAMLAVQAHTLDALFNELASRAAINLGEYIQTAEIYLKLALKAQSQCRTTIETLALIKNPPNVAFVKQANISNGPQQVNNAEPPRAEKTEIPPNNILEKTHGERLDYRTTGTTIGVDTPLEAVGAIHGTKNGGW